MDIARGVVLVEGSTQRRDCLTLLGGAAVACSHAARAEPPAVPTVGYLSTRSPGEAKYVTDAFARGLNDGGYVDASAAAALESCLAPFGPNRFS